MKPPKRHVEFDGKVYPVNTIGQIARLSKAMGNAGVIFGYKVRIHHSDGPSAGSPVESDVEHERWITF